MAVIGLPAVALQPPETAGSGRHLSLDVAAELPSPHRAGGVAAPPFPALAGHRILDEGFLIRIELLQ